MSDKKSVLEFLEEQSLIRQKTTVERTTRSEYQFSLVTRDFRTRLKVKPIFSIFTKENQEALKGTVEEYSIFEPSRLFVLKGYGKTFVERLTPPQGTYVLAEVDDGDLNPENFSYKQRRNILKVLYMQLGLDQLRGERKQQLSLSKLIKLDWMGCSDYEDHEPYLLLAKEMGWTADQLGEYLGKSEPASPLRELKRGQVLPVLQEADLQGETWLANQLTRGLGDLVYWRTLRLQGADPDKVRKEMDLGWRRGEELEAVSKEMTADDIMSLVQRRMDLDYLFLRNPILAGNLFLLNAPTRLRR